MNLKQNSQSTKSVKSSEQKQQQQQQQQQSTKKVKRKRGKRKQSVKCRKESTTQSGNALSKHVVPLLVERRRFIGPTIRFNKNETNNQVHYQVINRRTIMTKVELEKSNRVVKKLRTAEEAPTDNRDHNWKCSLCHLGSNTNLLGILYGPYDLGIVHSEAWFHEDCVVWSSSVYVIGNRIVNLRAMLEEAQKSICGRCGLNGATIGCYIKHCPHYSSIHYPCARQVNCVLDESNFSLYCPHHAAQLGRKASYIL